jgi:phage replication initiation protein
MLGNNRVFSPEETEDFKTEKELRNYWQRKGVKKADELPIEVLDPRNEHGFQGENTFENFENRFLYDWFSCSFKFFEPYRLLDYLGLLNFNYEITNGKNGYQKRLFYGGVSVSYEYKDVQNPRVLLELSGSGCRVFEEYGKGDWEELFEFVRNNPSICRMTRLDVAFDDFSGLINLETFRRQIRKGAIVAQASYYSVIESSDNLGEEIKNTAVTIYVGSQKSDCFVRFYDKAAQRGLDRHWKRAELVMKGNHALEFIKNPLPIGQKFGGVLNRYMRFVDLKGYDSSNKSKCPTSAFWLKIVKTAEKISIVSKENTEYTFSRLVRYIGKQCSNSIRTAVTALGVDGFLHFIRRSSILLPEKYRVILKNYALDYDLYGEEVFKQCPT